MFFEQNMQTKTKSGGTKPKIKIYINTFYHENIT